MPRTVRNPIAEFYQRRTPTQWALIGSLFAFLVLGYAVWDAFRDDPPPDVSDLLLDIQPVPDEENGLVTLNEIWEDLIEANYQTRLFEDVVHDHHEHLTMDWPKIANHLDDYESSLAKLTLARSQPSFTCNTLRDPSARPIALFEWSSISEILLVRSLLACHEGRFNDAWSDLLLNLEICHRIYTGDTAYYGVISTAGCLSRTAQLIETYALELTPNRTVTRQRTDNLKQLQPTPKTIRRLLLTDFMMMGIHLHPHLILEAEANYGAFAPVVYKPEQSLSHLSDAYREALANTELPWREHAVSIDRKLDDYAYSESFLNYMGKQGYNYHHPKIILHMFYLIKTKLSLARVNLALAGYTNQKDGELPEYLEALVPDYIDAIPLDPMDGEPLRYNQKERKIWSIGYNLINDHGEPGTSARSLDDVVVIPRPEKN